MSKRMQNLLCVLATLLIITVGVSYLGERLTPNFIGDAYNQMDAFHEQPENSIDVLGLGSSHAWKGCDTARLSDVCGANAWNYGCNWQHMNTTRLFLEDALKTQKPQVVVVECFYVEPLTDTDVVGEVYYTRHLGDSEAREKYLDECFYGVWSRYLAYYVPIISFHENWTGINRWIYKNPTDGYDFAGHHGYMASDVVVESSWGDYTSYAQKKFDDETESVLMDMVTICKENNIRLIFYLAPYDGEYAYFDALEKFADENDCTFLNLYELEGALAINQDTDFQDPGHLNVAGSYKVATYLGEYLIENQLLQ